MDLGFILTVITLVGALGLISIIITILLKLANYCFNRFIDKLEDKASTTIKEEVQAWEEDYNNLNAQYSNLLKQYEELIQQQNEQTQDIIMACEQSEASLYSSFCARVDRLDAKLYDRCGIYLFADGVKEFFYDCAKEDVSAAQELFSHFSNDCDNRIDIYCSFSPYKAKVINSKFDKYYNPEWLGSYSTGLVEYGETCYVDINTTFDLTDSLRNNFILLGKCEEFMKLMRSKSKEEVDAEKD